MDKNRVFLYLQNEGDAQTVKIYRFFQQSQNKIPLHELNSILQTLEFEGLLTHEQDEEAFIKVWKIPSSSLKSH